MLLAGALASACTVTPDPTASTPGPSPSWHAGPAAILEPLAAQRSDTAVRRWEEGRAIRFDDIGLDPWAVPADPDWAEDPYGDSAWLFRYHSLIWLQAPMTAYERTGRPRDLGAVRTLVMDWIRDNPRGRAASPRAWYDHAVAWRTDVFVWLTARGGLDGLTAGQRERFTGSLAEHGRVLRAYLDADRFVGHNHNLFHAMSLFNLATAVPTLPEATEWRTRARERIGELLGELLDVDEGVTTERSTEYHDLALRLFVTAARLLAANGVGFTDEELETIGRAARFALLSTQPDGNLPAIGDAHYGVERDAATYTDALALRDDPSARYLLTKGLDGTEPPDASFFPETGWAVFRPRYSAGPAWADDLHVVVRADPAGDLGAHGHDDAMSFTLFAGGTPWVVDTGGPYRYGDPLRADIVSSRSHNTVLVDGRPTPAGPTRIVGTGDEAGWSWIAAEHDRSPGVRHRRIVIVTDAGEVLVIDRLWATDGASHTLELLLHLAPEAEITLPATPGDPIVVGADGRSLELSIAGTTTPALGVVTGRTAPLLGWVTPAHRTLVPTPVLVASQPLDGTAWFASLFRPFDRSGVGLVVTVVGDTLVIDPAGPLAFEVPADGPPGARTGG